MKPPFVRLLLVTFCLMLFLENAGLCADTSATWLNGDGNWTDATQWDTNPAYPNNGNGVTYDATVNAGNVALDQDITIQRLFLNGGEVSGSFSLTLNQGLTMTEGGFAPTTLNLNKGSTSTISGGFFNSDSVNNAGTVNNSVNMGNGGTTINNLAGATWDQTLTSPSFWRATVNNAGTFVIHGGFPCQGLFQNGGSVIGDANSVFSFTSGHGGSSSSGSISVGRFVVGDQNFHLTAGATVTANSMFLSEGFLYIDGNTTINSDLPINFLGTLQVAAGATLTFNGQITQTSDASYVHLSGGTITTSKGILLQSSGNNGANFESSLTGSGTINGNVSNNAMIAPGGSSVGFGVGFVDSPGAITINGNLSMLSDAKLMMEIGGLTRGTQRDYLAISGMVTLNGTLVLKIINGFQMQLNGGQVITMLTSGDILAGMFTNVGNGERLTTADGSVSFQVNYGAGSAFDPDDLVLSDPEIVPEPTSLLLLAVGAAVIGFVRTRRR